MLALEIRIILHKKGNEKKMDKLMHVINLFWHQSRRKLLQRLWNEQAQLILVCLPETTLRIMAQYHW